MKGVGVPVVLLSQLISKVGFKPQPDPKPIPKGYGTVRFPHCFGHPGFVMVAAFVIVLVGAVALVGGEVVFVDGGRGGGGVVVGGGEVVLVGIIWEVANVKISTKEIKKGSSQESRATCLSCIVLKYYVN